MSTADVNFIYLLQALYGLGAAIHYLTVAVATLAVVGLLGYWVALRAARTKGK